MSFLIRKKTKINGAKITAKIKISVTPRLNTSNPLLSKTIF
jgi:hypothetical protein